MNKYHRQSRFIVAPATHSIQRTKQQNYIDN